MLVLFIEWIDIAILLFKLVPLEVSFQRCITVGMLEPAFAIHLPVSEVTLVHMPGNPVVHSLTIDHIFLELTFIIASVCEDAITLALSHVPVPAALILGKNSIIIA